MPRDVEALKRLYTKVFLGQEDYIPLLVGVPCPGGPGWGALWHDTRRAIGQAAQALTPRLAVGDDWLPTVNIGYFQNVIVPSLYGAEIVELAGSEPICRARFKSVTAAVDAGGPAIEGPTVDRMRRFVAEARAGLPEGYFLSLPPVSSPFDLAQLLLGEEFLIGLSEEPEATRQFLMNLAGLVTELTRLTKRELGLQPGEYITNRGIFFPGLRQPCDAIVNLSPAHLRAFVLPVLDRLGQAFEHLCIHYCTQPSPSRHVLGVLLESPHVRAVDNWQGPDDFIGPNAPARMQGRIAIIGDVDLSTPDKMDAFLALPPLREVPRKGGRGMVLSTRAKTVEEGQRIHREWRARFGR